jgi:hypothetical protein
MSGGCSCSFINQRSNGDNAGTENALARFRRRVSQLGADKATSDSHVAYRLGCCEQEMARGVSAGSHVTRKSLDATSLRSVAGWANWFWSNVVTMV